MTTIYTPNILLTYNGHDITEDFSPYLLDVIYTDFEQGQSDELSVTLKDNEGKFRGLWCPVKGDKLSCILYPKEGYLNCGTFTIDEVEYSGDSSGDICTMRSLAASHNKSVRTRNTIGYKSKTLAQIAKEIGSRQGFTVAGSQGNILIDKITQANETDLAFLRRVSSMYGYIFKITDSVLTFTLIEDLENSETLLKFDKSMIKNWSITDTSTRQYTACTASYYDPKSKSLKTYTAKNSGSSSTDTLKLTARYNSVEAAKRAAEIGLKNGSTEITGSLTLKEAQANFISGVNIELVDEVTTENQSGTVQKQSGASVKTLEPLKGFGIYNGTYHVTQATHKVSAGSYEVTGEIKKVKS